ncbi:BglG family transcription antiterminator [Staphylococcus pseudintermedius]|uniref:BglG family transcription antiterminator n=1 Tax=Staphylococcus pseudintermedius TaxID=283734 RepID=UPI001BDE48E6|nr:BglG family transcription antiterminator [Staphylococcus pseudintermedius]
MLTNRQFEILNKVIKAQDFISIAELANEFERSERTIQYDIEYIELMKEALQLQIQRSKSNGIKIECENFSAIRQMNRATFPDVHFTKSERHLQILLHLFEAKAPVNSRMLSTLVNVSRRTIVDDLKDVTEWLQAQALTLRYMKNKGFVIDGDEGSYRKAYGLIIHDYVKSTNELVRKTLFENEDMQWMRQMVIRTLEEKGYPLFQIALDGLVIHLLIAIQRVKKQFTMEPPTEALTALIETDAFRVAQAIAVEVEQHDDIAFPISETMFIALHLLSAKKLKIENDHVGTEELKILIHQFVERMSASLGIDLIRDTKLLNNLYLHLAPALNRLTYRFVQHNPIKQEIYTQYMEITEVITDNIWIFEELYEVEFTDDEMAYLTLHVASAIERLTQHRGRKIKIVLLCGSGIGTSQLLKEKLRKIYPEFDILNAYSLYQIDETQLKKRYVDYVITTVPIELESIECIKVTSFLDEKDREKLNDIINKERERFVHHLSRRGLQLKQVMKSEFLGSIHQKMSRNEAIAEVMRPLEQAGMIHAQYKKEIINKLDEFGAYMVISPHIALLHGSTEFALKGVGMTLFHFEQGVYFGHERFDPVKVMIGLATDEPQKHLTALKELSDILMDDTMRVQLLNGDLTGLKNKLACL